MGNVCASTSHIVLEQKYKSKKRTSLPTKTKHLYEKINDIIKKEEISENNTNNNGKTEHYSDDEDNLSDDKKSYMTINSIQTDKARSISVISIKTQLSVDVEGTYLYDDEIRSEDIKSMNSEFTNRSLVSQIHKNPKKKDGFKSKIIRKLKPKEIKEKLEHKKNSEIMQDKAKNESNRKNSDISLPTVKSNKSKKSNDSEQFIFKEERQINFPVIEKSSKTSNQSDTISYCSSYDALSNIIIPLNRYNTCIAHEPHFKESGVKWLTESVSLLLSY